MKALVKRLKAPWLAIRTYLGYPPKTPSRLTVLYHNMAHGVDVDSDQFILQRWGRRRAGEPRLGPELKQAFSEYWKKIDKEKDK